jgi:hypothetical protein
MSSIFFPYICLCYPYKRLMSSIAPLLRSNGPRPRRGRGTFTFLGFYVPLKNFSLIWRRHHCRWRAAKFRPMLGAEGLWAGRDLYRATPAVTQDLGFSGLIRRTAPFSRLLRHTRGCGGSILTRILTGSFQEWSDTSTLTYLKSTFEIHILKRFSLLLSMMNMLLSFYSCIYIFIFEKERLI